MEVARKQDENYAGTFFKVPIIPLNQRSDAYEHSGAVPQPLGVSPYVSLTLDNHVLGRHVLPLCHR